jgi:hypothetical protein
MATLHPGHPARLVSALSSSTSGPSDLWLVSAEGLHLPAHRLPLVLHSRLLRDLLASCGSLPASLSLPLPAGALSLLLSLLRTGAAARPAPFPPLQVLEAAELLGIEVDLVVNRSRDCDTSLEETLEPLETLETLEPLETLETIKTLEPLVEETQKEVVVDPKEEILQGANGKFACDSCEHETTKKSNMRTHLIMVHSENAPQLQCEVCQYRTKSRWHLKSHIIAKHSGVRFDCDFCRFQTAYKKALLGHIATKHNNGETPFLCNFCDFQAGFNKKKDLKTS